jgi:hypothetical protein
MGGNLPSPAARAADGVPDPELGLESAPGNLRITVDGKIFQQILFENPNQMYNVF